MHQRPNPVVFFSFFMVSSTALHVPPDGTSWDDIAPRWPAQPSRLDAAEEQDPALLAIAARFNPAMAFSIREIWPVEVRYAWHDGADLIARVEGEGERTVVKGADLSRVDWSGLPLRTPAGRAIRYYIDVPGDDAVDPRSGTSRWRQRFAEIAQAGATGSVTDSPYPPTQYVHAFWWNRAHGVLAMQYWFYYPYNEWVNRHEGDWEHIQILVRGSQRISADAAFVPVDHHYFFHGFWTAPAQVLRFGGDAPGEDHPLVYVGGHGDWFGFAGGQSGGSYPLPGRYPAAGFAVRWLSPDEDTSRPVRFIAASSFRLVLLPEPDRLDARRFPALSWLRLPFYAGQRTVQRNPPGMVESVGRPPLQPAARAEWSNPPTQVTWPGKVVPALRAAVERRWPAAWTCAEAVEARTCLGDRAVGAPRAAGTVGL